MPRLLLSFLFPFFFCNLVFSQINISGRVLNDISGEPLAGASVYINNSTIGSTTGAIESTITVLEHPCYLDRAGLLENPLSVQYSGFWSYEKLANMLPVDFNPPGRKAIINPSQIKP